MFLNQFTTKIENKKENENRVQKEFMIPLSIKEFILFLRGVADSIKELNTTFVITGESFDT